MIDARAQEELCLLYAEMEEIIQSTYGQGELRDVEYKFRMIMYENEFRAARAEKSEDLPKFVIKDGPKCESLENLLNKMTEDYLKEMLDDRQE